MSNDTFDVNSKPKSHDWDGHVLLQHILLTTGKTLVDFIFGCQPEDFTGSNAAKRLW